MPRSVRERIAFLNGQQNQQSQEASSSTRQTVRLPVGRSVRCFIQRCETLGGLDAACQEMLKKQTSVVSGRDPLRASREIQLLEKQLKEQQSPAASSSSSAASSAAASSSTASKATAVLTLNLGAVEHAATNEADVPHEGGPGLLALDTLVGAFIRDPDKLVAELQDKSEDEKRNYLRFVAHFVREAIPAKIEKSVHEVKKEKCERLLQIIDNTLEESKEQKRQNIYGEILQTERTYAERLAAFVEFAEKELVNHQDVEFRALGAKIRKLYGPAASHAGHLAAVLRDLGDAAMPSEAKFQHVFDLLNSGSIIKRYKKAIDPVVQNYQTLVKDFASIKANPRLAAVLSEMEQKLGYTLGSFAILPVQRLPRISMFMKDLHKTAIIGRSAQAEQLVSLLAEASGRSNRAVAAHEFQMLEQAAFNSQADKEAVLAYLEALVKLPAKELEERLLSGGVENAKIRMSLMCKHVDAFIRFVNALALSDRQDFVFILGLANGKVNNRQLFKLVREWDNAIRAEQIRLLKLQNAVRKAQKIMRPADTGSSSAASSSQATASCQAAASSQAASSSQAATSEEAGSSQSTGRRPYNGHRKVCRIRTPYFQEILDTINNGVIYLQSTAERRGFQVRLEDGRFVAANNGPFCTAGHSTVFSGAGTAIYVMDEDGRLYAASQEEGRFHHSSFLAGAPVLSAGELRTDEQGNLTYISNKSGHYRPNKEVLLETLRYLKENGVELAGVHVSEHREDGYRCFRDAAQYLETEGNMPVWGSQDVYVTSSADGRAEVIRWSPSSARRPLKHIWRHVGKEFGDAEIDADTRIAIQLPRLGTMWFSALDWGMLSGGETGVGLFSPRPLGWEGGELEFNEEGELIRVRFDERLDDEQAAERAKTLREVLGWMDSAKCCNPDAELIEGIGAEPIRLGDRW